MSDRLSGRTIEEADARKFQCVQQTSVDKPGLEIRVSAGRHAADLAVPWRSHMAPFAFTARIFRNEKTRRYLGCHSRVFIAHIGIEQVMQPIF